MKKCGVLLLILSMVLVSCSKSNEEKAQSLADEAIKKTLYIPDSYEPVSLELDSAFAPFDSNEFVQVVLQMCQVTMDLQEANEELEDAESDMAIWNGNYMSEYDKIQYNKAKAKYDKAQKTILKETEKVQPLREEFLKLKSLKREFIGFKALVTYRAKNNAGNVLMGQDFVTFNKELTEVKSITNTEDESYQMFKECSKMFLEQIQ